MSLGHSAFQMAYSLAPVSPPGCVPGYMALWLVGVIHLCLASSNSLWTTPSLQIKVCPSFRLLPLLFLQSIILCYNVNVSSESRDFYLIHSHIFVPEMVLGTQSE